MQVFTKEDTATMKAAVYCLIADDTIEDHGDGESGPHPVPVEGMVSNLDRFVTKVMTWRGSDPRDPFRPQLADTAESRRGWNDYSNGEYHDYIADRILGVAR